MVFTREEHHWWLSIKKGYLEKLYINIDLKNYQSEYIPFI